MRTLVLAALVLALAACASRPSVPVSAGSSAPERCTEAQESEVAGAEGEGRRRYEDRDAADLRFEASRGGMRGATEATKLPSRVLRRAAPRLRGAEADRGEKVADLRGSGALSGG